MTGGIRIEVATEPSAGLAAAMSRLVGQLSSSSAAPSVAELEEIVRAPVCTLLVARDGRGTIVGTLTLVVFRIPTGTRAWIEDVVVDESARGEGIGRALTLAALRLAGERGARSVDLTSRPTRKEANRLYRKLGFVERETNVYRFEGPVQ